MISLDYCVFFFVHFLYVSVLPTGVIKVDRLID